MVLQRVTRVRGTVAGLLAVLLLGACAGLAERGAEEAEALLFERKQKTYDLELERVYGAVRAYLTSDSGRLVSGSQENLFLEALVPDSDESLLRYEVSFELVVEGVTVRVQVYDADTGSSVEVADLYARFFSGVEANL